MNINLSEIEKSIPYLPNYKNFIEICIDFKKNEMIKSGIMNNPKDIYFTARDICVQNWKKNSIEINATMNRISKNNLCIKKCENEIKYDSKSNLTRFF